MFIELLKPQFESRSRFHIKFNGSHCTIVDIIFNNFIILKCPWFPFLYSFHDFKDPRLDHYLLKLILKGGVKNVKLDF